MTQVRVLSHSVTSPALPLSRSIIAHRSIAIENCERAGLRDRETTELCDRITRTQREEIAQMWRIPDRLGD